MAEYSEHYYQVGSVVCATDAHLVEQLNVGGGYAGRRVAPRVIPGRDGEHVALTTPRPGARTLRIPLRVLPFAVDGTPGGGSGGWYDQLAANRAAFHSAINGEGPIDLRWRMPDTGGFRDLRADAYCLEPWDWDTGGKVVWDAVPTFWLPYPYWKEHPMVARGAATSHSIDVVGSAPITHMVLTFGADGTFDDGTTVITVSGMTGSSVVVDTATRQVLEDGTPRPGLVSTSAGWPRWYPGETISVSASTAVAVDYHDVWE